VTEKKAADLIEECKPPFVVKFDEDKNVWFVVSGAERYTTTYRYSEYARHKAEWLNAVYYKGWRDAVERIMEGKGGRCA